MSKTTINNSYSADDNKYLLTPHLSNKSMSHFFFSKCFTETRCRPWRCNTWQ